MHFAARQTSDATGGELDPPNGSERHVAQTLRLVEAYENARRRRFEAIQKTLGQVTRDGGHDLVLFGAGTYARLVLEAKLVSPGDVSCIVDNNRVKWGRSIHGVPIRPPSFIERSEDPILIASDYEDEIRDQLRGMGVPDERILTLS